MSYNPATGFPRVVLEINYRDATAALLWLVRVFGFREILRWSFPDGTVGHADMDLEGGVVMLSAGSVDYRPPAESGCVYAKILVFVSNVDSHFRHARAEGATILSGPKDKPWGLRQYVASDIEGHTWEFSEYIRDVPPEAWGASASSASSSTSEPAGSCR